jgi:hypothetical protein
MKKIFCLSLLLVLLSFGLTSANSNAERLNTESKGNIESKSDKLKDFVGTYKNTEGNNLKENNGQINLEGLPEAAETRFPLIIIQGPDIDSKIFVGPPAVEDDKILKRPEEGNNSPNGPGNGDKDSSSTGLIEIKSVSDNK